VYQYYSTDGFGADRSACNVDGLEIKHEAGLLWSYVVGYGQAFYGGTVDEYCPCGSVYRESASMYTFFVFVIMLVVGVVELTQIVTLSIA
jgi:hypothetical protein